MSEKTTENKAKVKVEVTAPDGHVEVFTGDTAIVFTIEKGDEFMDGKAKMIDANAAFVGHDIPEQMFSPTIGSLVGSFVKQRSKEHPMLAAFELRNIARILEAYENEIVSGQTPGDKKKALDEAVENLVKAILS